MLQIKNIKKSYRTGDLVQTALDDVSLNFRDNEFVSILGKSGSGKSTLLNVIGGLDRYDSGDLIINGISTKKYKDRDWDSYRNHTIGFIFQSYNLIPHQTVLANVELALTIAGVSRKERKKRAKIVLEKVGLADQIHKKPFQMSGGQMQRVAIARALINDPDILLADEPTGALDTATSIQIMELLKEVAKDRLVIMVTHNPELAENYSTRIVRLKDGKIIDDSDSFEPDADECREQEAQQPDGHKNMGRARMSFATSLALSFNNLKNKKGRTLLTSFAGSIGIIGIALILALSSSVDAYITSVQRETMDSYPIVINSESFNLTGEQSFMGGFNSWHENENDGSGVFGDPALMPPMEAMAAKLVENNLFEFKKYLDDPNSEINQYIGRNGVKYGYDVAFQVYTHDCDGNLINADSDPADSSDSNSIFGDKMPMRHPFKDMQGSSSFSQMIDGLDGQLISDLINENYEMLYGSWPKDYNEVVLVLNRNNALSPLVLYHLGLITAEKYNEIADKTANNETVPEMRWDYEELLSRELYLLPNHDRYIKNEHGTFTLMNDNDIKMDEFVKENAVPLKISGIIRPAEESSDAIITTSVAYTSLLTKHIADAANESEVVSAQRETPDIDVLTGLKFEVENDAEKASIASGIISKMGISEKAQTYQMILYMQSKEDGNSDKPEGKTGENTGNGENAGNIEDIGNIGNPGDTGSGIPQKPVMDEVTMAAAMDKWLEETPDEKILVEIYDMSVGETSYDENMKEFGEIDFDRPVSIGIYIDSFDAKEGMNLAIDHYNESVEEENRIYYTDYVALLTSSVSTIIDTISYVLIAFVAVSLIVSCIMIGIITHISVLERTKEIGILRALGASKANISQVFNAETFIIGACSGILGVLIASLLTIPANAIIRNLLGDTLKVSLPITYSGILTLLSIIITVLGGLLPAHKAAKKDPVEALRTE